MSPLSAFTSGLKVSAIGLVAVISAGLAQADAFIIGYHAYLNGDSYGATQAWKPEAENGDLMSQLGMAKLAIRSRDWAAATRWNDAAATQGYLPAKAWLAMRTRQSETATSGQKGAALLTLKEADVQGFRSHNVSTFRASNTARMEPRNRYERAVAKYSFGELSIATGEFNAELAQGNSNAKSWLACISVHEPIAGKDTPPRPLSEADARSYLLSRTLQGDWIAAMCAKSAFPDNASAQYILDGLADLMGHTSVAFVPDHGMAMVLYEGPIDVSLTGIQKILSPSSVPTISTVGLRPGPEGILDRVSARQGTLYWQCETVSGDGTTEVGAQIQFNIASDGAATATAATGVWLNGTWYSNVTSLTGKAYINRSGEPIIDMKETVVLSQDPLPEEYSWSGAGDSHLLVFVEKQTSPTEGGEYVMNGTLTTSFGVSPYHCYEASKL